MVTEINWRILTTLDKKKKTLIMYCKDLIFNFRLFVIDAAILTCELWSLYAI